MPQYIDEIIAEEGLDKPQDEAESTESLDTSDSEDTQDQAQDTQTDDTTDDSADSDDTNDTDKSEDDEQKEESEDSKETDDTEEKVEKLDTKEVEENNSAVDRIEQSKSYVDHLEQNGYQPYDDKGNLRTFKEVLPPGTFLLSKMEPVKVQDKDGKSHEFVLLSDLEKAFPDGFDAKNNIEQMKLQNGLAYNETQFRTGIKEYDQAKAAYEQETTKITQQAQSQESIASEYRAMAKEGLVPEVGDPKDPNFNKSDAVKELNGILAWMETKNKELSAKGLGTITSLYVAKQLMGTDTKVDDKKTKAKEIDQQRKQTASLSRSGGGKDREAPKKSQPNSNSLSPHNFVEQIIAEEGLV